MVIYLNVPTVTPTTAILPSEPTTITLPPSEPMTGNDLAPASGEAMIDAEMPLGEAPTEPTPTDEIVPTEQAVPEEEIDAEQTPAPAQE